MKIEVSKFNEIAQRIGINSAYLRNMTVNSDKLYNAYYMPKSSGKTRQIEAPNNKLKAIQTWILRNVLEGISVSDRAQGFIKGRSIKSNARFHLGKKYILVTDIKDFFPSISSDDVYRVFYQIQNYEEIATLYTKLCTYSGRLPQGAVTSPMLSNLVFREVDDKLVDICDRMGIAYSRYADDMTFSSNDLAALKELYEKINVIITTEGYDLNDSKTRYYSGKGRMLVTGLILNSGRMTIGRRRKRNIRATLLNYFVNNDDSVNINKLFGSIAFLRDIEPEYYLKLKEYVNRIRIKHLGNN